MGIDTKGLLHGNVSVFEILKVLESAVYLSSEHALNKRVSGANISTSIFPYDEFLNINFNWKPSEIEGEKVSSREFRTLSVLWKLTDYKEITGGEEYTLISFGKWGSSIEIVTLILEAFGGFILEDDCIGEWKRIDKR